MKSTLKDERGAVLIFELVVLAIVLAAAGFAVYQYLGHKSAPNKTATPKPHVAATASPSSSPNPYAGWETCADKYEGISFKYPSNWVVKLAGTNPCGSSTVQDEQYVDFFSAVASNNMLYQLRYWADHAIGQSPTPGSPLAGDSQSIVSVTPIQVTGGKASYYLIAYVDTCCGTSASSGQISQYAVTDQKYSVGQVFYGTPFVTSQNHLGDKFMLTVRLTKGPQGTQDIEDFTPAEFQANPSYNDLMNVLKSLTY